MAIIKKKPGIFHAALKPKDTITQTDGCRHSNPGICANNSMQNICAFVRNDGICLKPPASWPKQYKKLKETSVDD